LVQADLRFIDNEALFSYNSGLPLVLIYCFEPTVMNSPDSDVRHWRFIYESIQDLNEVEHNKRYLYFFMEVQTVFSELLKNMR
jgi:deoxyribodipyrimidine photo-lyase